MGVANSSNAIDALNKPIKNNAKWPLFAIGAVFTILYLALSMFILGQINKIAPNEITLAAFGFSKTIHNIHDRIGNLYLLMFILFPVGFAIEAMITGWQKSSLYRILFARTKSIELDLACFALSQAQVYNVIKLVLTFGLAVIFGKFINEKLAGIFGLKNSLGELPLLLQIPVFYVVYTFFDYWDHRIEHTKYFWPFHRFHHSAEDFCMVTTMRQHPAAFVSIFVINAPMAILGASTSAMIWVNLLVTIVGMLQHSNIDSDYGWIGKYLVQSPNHHRKHHILDISEGVGHFGIMPLWDRLFGTWAGDADQSIAIGVEKHYQHGFWFIGDVMRDYFDFFKGLVGIKVDPYDFDAAKKTLAE